MARKPQSTEPTLFDLPSEPTSPATPAVEAVPRENARPLTQNASDVPPDPCGCFGVKTRTFTARVAASRPARQSLLDFENADGALPPVEPLPQPTTVTPQNGPSAKPTAIPDRTADPPLAPMASGEKAKAKDILAAVRIVKQLDREQRAVTFDERLILARFGGFGPVALSLFPHALTGKYKDESWKALGEELKSLLNLDEYESARRTTFNAFYTSPTVIHAIHSALCRLGVPSNALALEPGCGSGNFMAAAPREMRFIGVELDRISGRVAQLRHPIRTFALKTFAIAGCRNWTP